jgi:DNA-binding response OmpR family regulator
MDGQTIHLLMVEDDSFLREMYKTKLQSESFDVQVARDGVEGLEKIKELKPDMVLLDIMMPRMDGFEVLQTVKDDPELKDIPVILLTNLGQDSDVKKGKEMGAADYIIKSDATMAEVSDKVKSFFTGDADMPPPAPDTPAV